MLRKGKACLVLFGNPRFDNRVLRHAQTLKKLGFHPVIYSFLTEGDSEDLIHERIQIKIKSIRFNSIIQRIKHSLFNLTHYPVSRIAEELAKERAELYVANDLPTLLFCRYAASKNNSFLVYDSHELFLEAHKGNQIAKYNLVKRAIHTVHHFVFFLNESRLITTTDLNLTVNYSISDIIAKRYRIQRPLVIRNVFEYQKPMKKRLFHKKFKLDSNKKIILYQGGLSPKRGLKLLINALLYLDDKYVIIFMGKGCYKVQLRELAIRLNKNNRVFFAKPVSKSRLISYTASADVGYLFYHTFNLNQVLTLPNKLFEYMMAGLPIVAQDLPEIRQIVNKEQIGILISEKASSEELARAIQNAFLPSNWKRFHNNALKKAKQKYKWEREEKKLKRAYKKVFDNILTNEQ